MWYGGWLHWLTHQWGLTDACHMTFDENVRAFVPMSTGNDQVAQECLYI